MPRAALLHGENLCVPLLWLQPCKWGRKRERWRRRRGRERERERERDGWGGGGGREGGREGEGERDIRSFFYATFPALLSFPC